MIDFEIKGLGEDIEASVSLLKKVKLE